MHYVSPLYNLLNIDELYFYRQVNAKTVQLKLLALKVNLKLYIFFVLMLLNKIQSIIIIKHKIQLVFVQFYFIHFIFFNFLFCLTDCFISNCPGHDFKLYPDV